MIQKVLKSCRVMIKISAFLILHSYSSLLNAPSIHWYQQCVTVYYIPKCIELPQTHCDNKREGKLFSWFHHGDITSMISYTHQLEAVVRRYSIKKYSEKFHKINRKTPVPEIFFKKSKPSPATLLKKSLWHRCFPVNFAKLLRTPISTEHLRWLLLKIRTE